MSVIPIGQEEPPIGTGFWASLQDFVRTYPWQTAAIAIAVIAVLVNIKSTRTLVKTLQLKKG